MTDLVERYLLLGLRLGRHVDGFVDAYYGPAELKAQADSEEPVDPAELVREAAALQEETATLDDEQRARWLAAQLEGLAATAERLAGMPVSFADEVRRCYGVDPAPAAEDELADAHRRLEELIPGDGPLAERYRAWRQRGLSSEALLPALEALQAELRSRSQALFGLPDGESVRLELVSNEPWAGFNYYLGGLRSRVVFNTDIPPRPELLPEITAHETYPGHHAEHAWKEELLVRDRGYLEESIFLTGTPQSLISEGIAKNSLEVLGDEAERACAEILAGLGSPYDVDLTRAIAEAEGPILRVAHNVALMLHEQGRSVDEARDFALRWSLRPEPEVQKLLDFGLHPVWRAYVVVYEVGAALVRAFVGGDPARYRRLLTEQLTTADLH